MYDNPWNASISQNSEDDEEDMDECPEEETSEEENDTEIGFDQTNKEKATRHKHNKWRKNHNSAVRAAP